MTNNLRNYLNLFFSKFFRIIMTNYLKLNMRLFHFMDKFVLTYFIYLSILFYSVFIAKDISKFITLFIGFYVAINALVFFILFKIIPTCQFIQNLVGKEFFLKYPQPNLEFILWVFCPIFFIVMGVLTSYLMKQSLDQAVLIIKDAYCKEYGIDMINWEEKVKEDYSNDVNRALNTVDISTAFKEKLRAIIKSISESLFKK